MKIKFIILLLLTSFLGFSQTLESMKVEVQKIYDLTIEKKYEIIVETTYPKVFEVIPKDQFVKIMKEGFNPKGMTIAIVKGNPEFTFKDIQTIDKNKYCIIEYNNTMTLKFDQELGESKEMFLGLVKESMKNYTATIDEKTEVITVEGRAKMIAISDQLTNGTWKYLNYNGESPELMEKVLGAAVIAKLGL